MVGNVLRRPGFMKGVTLEQSRGQRAATRSATEGSNGQAAGAQGTASRPEV